MTDVVDMKEWKKNKELVREGRTPLYVSHLTGKVTGNPDGKSDPDFGDRLQRIRASLEKINRLMAEIKQMGKDERV